MAGLSRPSETYAWTTARVTTCIRARPRCRRQRAPSRRVHVDFRGFDGDPHPVAAVEPELAHRRRCHLGHDRGRASKAHSYAIALQIQVNGAAFPDISRRAIWARAIERDGTRIDRKSVV